MEKIQFINLKKGMIIYNNDNDQVMIVESSFVEPSLKKIKDSDLIVCTEFFMKKEVVQIPVSEHNKWKQFQIDFFMEDMNQNLINKFLLKRIMVLEAKLLTISNILK